MAGEINCEMSRKLRPTPRLHVLGVMVTAAVLACVFSFTSYARSTEQEKDKVAIRALIDKINRAWKLQKPSTLFQEILSDKGCVFVMPKADKPSEALIINKQMFCEVLDRVMMQRQRPQKHEHKVESITIIGPLAYGIGTVLDIGADGSRRNFEMMNFFAKDDTGWKLVSSALTDNVKRALHDVRGDEEQVRKLTKGFFDAFSLNDAKILDKAEELYADNILLVFSNGMKVQGKENAIDLHRKALKEAQSEFEGLTVRHNIESVNITGETAVVFGKVQIDARRKDSDGSYNRDVWTTLIFRKIDGSWQIIQEQATTAAATANGKAGEQKLSAEQTRLTEEGIRGTFSGIGIEIDTHADGIFVKRVIDGGPADNAGLNAEEIVTAIDSQSTRGMSLERAVSLIKGLKGTSVKLKVRSKNGASRDVNVVRGTVVISGTKSRLLNPDIGLLTITAFTKQTSAEVREAIKYFQEQKVRGLILDLRNNRGGFYPAACEVAGMFVGRGKAMWRMQRTGQDRQTIVRAQQSKIVLCPVVVLISPETQSAGELLASALRSINGSKLLGQTTSGKVIIYRLEKQADGTSKKVVFGYFFTADGRSFNNRGIRPDRLIDPKTSPEDALQQAVSELSKGMM